MPINRRHRRQTEPTFTWVLLMLLVWSQASFALHQFDHSIGELGETCAVCLKSDREDDVVVDAGSAPVLPAASFAIAVEDIAAVRAGRFSHYQSRASP